MDASFAVNLFPHGFGIDRPTEKCQPPPLGYEVMEWMYPYDRSSECFLRAIDGGWLPAELLDDIPCNYVDGCVLCEIRDYRDCVHPSRILPKAGLSGKGLSNGWVPKVQMVLLQPGMENIVKDVAKMADVDWSYSDLLEVESKILNSVQPALTLDPSPDVARRAHIAFYDKWKLNSGARVTRRYRSQIGALGNRRLQAISRKYLAQSAEYGDLKAQRQLDIVHNFSGRSSSPFPEETINYVNSNNVHPLSRNVSQLGTDSVQDRGKGGPGHPQTIGWPSARDQVQDEAFELQEGGVSATEGTHASMSLAMPHRQLSSSPSLSTSATPLTPSTRNGGADIGGAVWGESRLESTSTLGKRGSRESLLARVDTKKVKQEQAKAEMLQQHHQKVQQKAEAKLSKEKQQTQVRIEAHNSTGQRTLLQHISDSPYLSQEEISIHSQTTMNPALDGQLGAAVSSDSQQESSEREGIDSKEGEQQQAQVPNQEYDENLVHEEDSVQPVRQQIPKPSSVQVGQFSQFVTSISESGGKNEWEEVLSEQGILIDDDAQGDENILKQQQLQWAQKLDARAQVASPRNSDCSAPAQAPLLEQSTLGQCTKEDMSNTLALVSAIQRHNLHVKQEKVEKLPPVNNKKPSWHLLLVALADTPDEQKEQLGCRNMATSLVGGMNARKNRTLLFQKLEQVFQGHSSTFHRSRMKLCLSERSKDLMVEAVIQIGDDHDDELHNPSITQHAPPMMHTTGFSKQVFIGVYSLHEADRFACQYSDLMREEGYELVEDEVYVMSRTAASNARPMSAGATTMGSLMHASSPTTRMSMGQDTQPTIIGAQIAMQPSSTNSRMPPPGNVANRQLLAGHLGQSMVASAPKTLQLDTSPQLVAAQQHHQLVHLQRQQPHVSLTGNQLAAQMTGQPHNQQQLNASMVAHAPHLQQFQFLQQQQQQHHHHQQQHHQQQQQHHQQQQKQQQQYQQHQQQQNYQRKSLGLGMGGMNGMNNINGGAPGMGNLVGLNGISGMTTMSPVTGSIMGLSGLTNMGINSLGQNSVGNLMGQQMRPGTLTNAQPLSSKARVPSTRVRAGNIGAQPGRTQLDNVLVGQGSPGVSMIGQPLARANLAPMQRATGTGIPSPKNNATMSTGPGQVFGMSSAPNPQQITAQHLSQQHLTSQPLNAGVLGSLVGAPTSPQLSTQSLSSVPGLTNSGLDLQNVNRGNSLMPAAGRGRRTSLSSGQSS